MKPRQPAPTSGLTGFDIDASVSVSDLRRESASWQERLARYGKLRVERRSRGASAVVGVLVAPEVWRELRDLLATYQAAEEEEIARLIEERAGAEVQQGQALVARTAELLAQRVGRPNSEH